MESSKSHLGWVRSVWLLPALISIALIILGYFLSEYLVYVATSWIAFGMVALALSLVWSKAGDLSLGHTVFFGLGAYAYGIVAINISPFLGGTVYQAIVIGLVVGGVTAVIVGYFLFYGRLGPLQVTIITYTLVLLVAIVAVGLSFKVGRATVGGANGMGGIPALSLSLFTDTVPLSRYAIYTVALVICAATYILLRRLLSSTFGLVIDGIRQNILRTELLGYDVRWYRLILFMISGAIAGVGGAIYAAWASYISPSVFSIGLALFIPIYVLVGGLDWLAGAFVGTLVVGGLSFWLGGGVAGGQTALILGMVLILLVLFAPRGILGLFSRRTAHRAGGSAQDAGSSVNTDSDYDISQLKHIFGAKPTGDTVFEVRSLKKRFGGVVATDNVNLKFTDHGIHCLIGPNGAGKSTLLNTCLGLLKADGGQVLFYGQDITGWEPYRRVKAGLGIKLQVARILEENTVRESLWLAAYGRLERKTQVDVLVDQVLHLVGLSARADMQGGELSHGEKQWLDLGMVLCLAPAMLLLDEPAAGMTIHERQHMVAMLRKISDFASIIVVEHDMDFVRSLDAPVTVLHQGAVFATGSITELRQDPRVLDIYLGRRRDA